jgi:hypothetical protein
MVLNKIPTFQEVKDWANGQFTTLTDLDNHEANGSAHHSRYSDGEARGAVRQVEATGSVGEPINDAPYFVAYDDDEMGVIGDGGSTYIDTVIHSNYGNATAQIHYDGTDISFEVFSFQ